MLDKKEFPTRAFSFALGVWLGAATACAYLLSSRKDLIERMTEDVNLRTDLINWITGFGIHMEKDEFAEEFRERARFINIVTEEKE